MIKLIAGYLHVTGGHIRIDGQSLQDVALKSYYNHIGYLTQEPNVFDGTIYDNLTYAIEVDNFAPKELEEKMAQSLQKSKCEFIYDLPQ